MKELISLLNIRERRLVSGLGASLGIAACLFVFLAVRVGGQARRTARDFDAASAQAKGIEAEREAARTSRQAWADAQKDIAKLKGAWMYDPKDAVRGLRLDLERIFEASGIAASDIVYGYASVPRTRIQKVSAEFRFFGNYLVLKRLLDVVERQPRLLLVEKIDFLGIGKPPGSLELRVSLAGYYEN
jgi:hypothetical protein